MKVSYKTASLILVITTDLAMCFVYIQVPIFKLEHMKHHDLIRDVKNVHNIYMILVVYHCTMDILLL